MYRKNCCKCGRPSYSSCEHGEWLCPTCGNDLTKYPHFDGHVLEKLKADSKKSSLSYKTSAMKKKRIKDSLLVEFPEKIN